MGIPQIIMIGFMFMALGMELIQHGKTTEQKHNFWVMLVSMVIKFMILKSGGFF